MNPSHQERVFKQSYALELLSIAEADWSTALYLRKGLQQHAVRSENFFFFVQQTLEKLLKAVLVSQQLPVPLVHDLGILIAKIPREIEPPFGYEINRLSEFAAIRRYEESSLTWNEEEADEAIELGQKAVSWAKTIIQ
jgi:HEPN domain-containing protein